MIFSKQQKQQLTIKAQKIKPVVLLGSKGLTENILTEIDNALNAHELVKIRLNIDDSEEKKALTDAICKKMQADLILAIGHVISIYRPKTKKK